MAYKKVEVIEARGIFLNIRIRMWGARSKVEEGKIDLPPDIVRATQDLLTEEDSNETLKKLRKIKTTDIAKFIRNNALPCPIIAFDMIRRDSVSKANEFLKQKQKEFYALVDEIDIEKCKENFKKKHPKFYRPEKYPSERFFKSHFEFTWSFHELKPSDVMKDTAPKVFEEEQKRWKKVIRKMQDDTIQIVAAEINMRVKNLKAMCSDKKRISQRTINGLNSLLEKWDELWSGFVSSAALKDAIKNIRTNIADLEAEDLRFDTKTKKQIKKVTNEILNTVKTEMETVGKRSLIY